jgi:hypothetical protein
MAFKMKKPTFYYGSSKTKTAMYQRKDKGLKEETMETFEPAYLGADISMAQLAGMSDKELKKYLKGIGQEDTYSKVKKDLVKEGYKTKKGAKGPVKEAKKY